MLADVYDTIFDILKSEFPKNASQHPVVLDREVRTWLYGEQTVHPGALAISIQSAGSTSKEIGQNILEYEHKIKLKFYSSDSSTELSERLTLEFSRIVRNIMLPHRRIYVIQPCPIDGKSMMSPLHFSTEHDDIFGPYIATATTNMSTEFYETHDNSTTLPTISTEALTIQALEMIYSDVANNIAVSGLPTGACTKIQQNITLNRQPIRFLERVTLNDSQPSAAGEEQALLHNGEFTIIAKELVRQPAYGPDNVYSSAYPRIYTKKT